MAVALPSLTLLSARVRGSDETSVAARIRMPVAVRFRLPNGLDVILQENHRQPQVAVLLAYDIGSRDDPTGYRGLAHLVEHMTYRGSRHLGPIEGPATLDSTGAHDQNGMTSLDYTLYQSVVPRAALATALWVESERMAFTLERFDQTSLDLERKTIESELRIRNDLDTSFNRALREAMFGSDHAYAQDGRSDATSRQCDSRTCNGSFSVVTVPTTRI